MRPDRNVEPIREEKRRDMILCEECQLTLNAKVKHTDVS